MATPESMEVEPSPVAKPARSPHELLEQTRAAIEDVAARLLFLKKESNSNSKSELRGLVSQMSLLLITLRQVNRTILMEEDRVRSETEAAKAPVDSTTLQLHNLLYEKNHYVKAIKACRDFQTKYPGIELVPEEEFRRDAPEEIKENSLATDAAHDLMLKRLSFEVFQRKELCKLHEKLEQRKTVLLDTISDRKRFLSSLPSHLRSLKRASLPVQNELGMLHTKKLKQHRAAELLPTPLYIAYTQLLAQKEAFGERIEVEVVGSTKDAQVFAQQQASKENGALSNGDTNRLEDDVIDEDEDVQRRRSRSKKNVVKETANPPAIDQLHPLKIILTVFDDGDSETKPLKLITLRFEYLVKLNAVCVGLEDAEASDNDILCNLFPDDTGLELPHQMAKLSAGDSLHFSERSSRPYKWAQHLAGIDFLPVVPLLGGEGSNEAPKSAELSSGLALYRQQNRAQTILQRLRSRKISQTALMWQLEYLSKHKWPAIADINTPWASHTPLCSLQSWSPTGLISDLSAPVRMTREATIGIDSDLDRRSVTAWEEAESTREDGELPLPGPVENTQTDALEESNMRIDSTITQTDISTEFLDRGLSLISKSVTVPKKNILHTFSRNEDDLDLLLLDGEGELEEQIPIDLESEKGSFGAIKPWEDCALRVFNMILSKTLRNDQIVKLEAKVKISIEYPVRPPLFTLSLLGEGFQCLKWHNELRAMEAEVNLHILKIVPLSSENYMLAHQVRCLAMLFDIYFQEDHENRKVTSVVDVGLGKPVSGYILARSVRGRDRRKTIYWRGTSY